MAMPGTLRRLDDATAAYLAGLGAGLFKNEKDISARWVLDRRFRPAMKKEERERLYSGWNIAVSRVR